MNFSDLDEECKLNVLQYMCIKDRIKLERASREWKRMLNRVWLTQNALSFIRVYDYNLFCDVREHKIRLVDCYDLPDGDILTEEDKQIIWCQILKKCPNLKILHYGFNYSQQELVRCLGQFCPNLEHVQGFILKEPDFVFPVYNDKIKCLEVDEYSYKAAIERQIGNLYFTRYSLLDPVVLKYVSDNRNLIKSLQTESYSSEIVELLEPQKRFVFHVDFQADDSANLLSFQQMASKCGKKLEFYRSSHQETDFAHYKRLLSCAPNLRHATIYLRSDCFPRHTMELLRNFKLLTTVDIVVGEGADLTYLGDIQKLTEHSRTLKRFTFVLSDFAWDAEYEEFLEDYGPQASPGLKEDAVQHCKNVWAIYINQLISMVSCYAKRLPANKVELYLLHGRYKVEPYLYRVMKQVVSHTEVPDNLYVLVGPQGEVI